MNFKLFIAILGISLTTGYSAQANPAQEVKSSLEIANQYEQVQALSESEDNKSQPEHHKILACQASLNNSHFYDLIAEKPGEIGNEIKDLTPQSIGHGFGDRTALTSIQILKCFHDS